MSQKEVAAIGGVATVPVHSSGRYFHTEVGNERLPEAMRAPCMCDHGRRPRGQRPKGKSRTSTENVSAGDYQVSMQERFFPDLTGGGGLARNVSTTRRRVVAGSMTSSISNTLATFSAFPCS